MQEFGDVGADGDTLTIRARYILETHPLHANIQAGKPLAIIKIGRLSI